MHTDDAMLARLKKRAALDLDTDLQSLLGDFDAMRYDLETSEGLIVDDAPGSKGPGAFPLHHKSIEREK